MTGDLKAKAERFGALHREPGCFVMPNPWNAGSARILAAAGFPALATTSAGIAFGLGLPDYADRVPRARMLEECAAIAAAVDLPVSGDLEAGYGDRPEDVAETVRLAIAAGLAGGSIEDHRAGTGPPLYELEEAAERIAAARAAIDAAGLPFVLTARAECYLTGHPEPFKESVRRLNAYREAGADCLYAPGQKGIEEIGALVREVAGPVNVVMGLAGHDLSVDALAQCGVKRISIGGSLARAGLELVKAAGEEMRDLGTFSFAERRYPGWDINTFMGKRPGGR